MEGPLENNLGAVNRTPELGIKEVVLELIPGYGAWRINNRIKSSKPTIIGEPGTDHFDRNSGFFIELYQPSITFASVVGIGYGLYQLIEKLF